MMLSHRLTLATVCIVTAACADAPIPVAPVSLARTANLSEGVGPFANFTPIAGSATCGALAPPATLAGFATYQPFILPEGYRSSIVTTELDPGLFNLGKGVDNFDMLTLNETGPHAGRFLYRTHEVGSNGSLSETDLVTGVTRIVANASHYEGLDGIVWTPWGTVLFSEERIVATLKDPAVPDAVGGLVYEYNPETGTTRPLPALGAASHEGLRFDSEGNLYGISESTPGLAGQSGAIFKFVPDTKGDLTSGQLYALKVLDATTRTGPAVWVALDRAAVKINADAEALRVGATGWRRPEDVEIGTNTGNNHGGTNVMYVATTTDAVVLRIELNGDEAFVSNFVSGSNVPGFTDPDNLVLDHQGNLFILEDNGPGDIWVARVKGGGELVASEVVRFASLTDCAAEPTGAYFDRDGKTMLINVQHAGGALRADLTVAIHRER